MNSKWTLFWDMHSGGNLKEKWQLIYIELPYDEAVEYFIKKFGHNPHDIACDCCGNNYSISEENTFAEISAYHRNCKWVTNDEESGGGHYKEEAECDYKDYVNVEDYKEQKNVLVITKKETQDD